MYRVIIGYTRRPVSQDTLKRIMQNKALGITPSDVDQWHDERCQYCGSNIGFTVNPDLPDEKSYDFCLSCLGCYETEPIFAWQKSFF